MRAHHLDLDPSVLDALKKRQKSEGKSLGKLASELLAVALAEPAEPSQPLVWHTQRMGIRVDLEDKDAVAALLDTYRPE